MCLPLGPVGLWGFRMYEAYEFPTIFVFKCYIFHLIITSILIGMNSGSSVNHFNTLSPSEVMGTNTYNLFIFLHPEQLSVRSGKERHTSEAQWLPTCEGSDLTILYNSTIIQIYTLKTKPASQYSVLVCAQNISIKSLIRKKNRGQWNGLTGEGACFNFISEHAWWKERINSCKLLLDSTHMPCYVSKHTGSRIKK